MIFVCLFSIGSLLSGGQRGQRRACQSSRTHPQKSTSRQAFHHRFASVLSTHAILCFNGTTDFFLFTHPRDSFKQLCFSGNSVAIRSPHIASSVKADRPSGPEV